MRKHIFNEKKFKQLYKEKYKKKITQGGIAEFLGVNHPQQIQIMSYRNKGLNTAITWLNDLSKLVDCSIEELIIEIKADE